MLVKESSSLLLFSMSIAHRSVEKCTAEWSLTNSQHEVKNSGEIDILDAEWNSLRGAPKTNSPEALMSKLTIYHRCITDVSIVLPVDLIQIENLTWFQGMGNLVCLSTVVIK